MRKLVWGNSFRRELKRLIHDHPHLSNKVFSVLEKLLVNPYNPSLKTHKLSGKLEGLWSCWVEYDCRIVFTFSNNPTTNEDLIVLIDIGKHEDVY
ncbi:MAG: type II toxin-antitoxin system mRNA interferase toxin, RelE/StbE family [Candidatus Omnitrophota bacterium]|jgi:addiction module RelE/StbE family toxin|nr:MAG: type II toxin-antitoxin system mRNA interferase toxin, RelE/StbE family [Candidatus Omnitrophota bacterium]